MKKLLLTALICLIPQIALADAVTNKCSVWFSPRGGVTQAIVDLLGQAAKPGDEVRIAAFQYTSKPINDKVKELVSNGVDVRLVVDRSAFTARGSLSEDARANGVTVVYDKKHKINHNKVIIVNRRHVLTGSFNFTGNAETGNAENALICDSKDLAKVYLENWELHAAHSVHDGASSSTKK